MNLDEFLEKYLDHDRVYDHYEVEEVIRQAWVACLENLKSKIMTQKLRFTAETDQEEAKLERFIDEMEKNE